MAPIYPRTTSLRPWGATSVHDIARTDVVTAGPDATAAELAATTADGGVGSVVVEDGTRPVGVVTDRDLAVGVVAEGLDPETATAEDVMTPEPTVASVDDGIFQFTALMCEAGVRRVPIVDGDELAGLVAMDDLVVLLADELRNLAGVVEAEPPPY